MTKKSFDHLLSTLYGKNTSNKKLIHLESDVWHAIQTLAKEKSLSWCEKMILAFNVPAFQFASIAMVLAVSISVGMYYTLNQAGNSKNDLLALSVFTTGTPYLPSNLIVGNK